MGSERDNNSPLRELEWLSRFYEKRGRKDLVQDIMTNLHNFVPLRRNSKEQNLPPNQENSSKEGSS